MFLTFFPFTANSPSAQTAAEQRHMLKNSQPSKKISQQRYFRCSSNFQHFRRLLFSERTSDCRSGRMWNHRSSWWDKGVRTEDTKSPEESPAKAIFSYSLREQLSLIGVGLRAKRRFVCFSCYNATERKNNSKN